MNISRSTIILIILALLVLGAAGYLLFGRQNTEPGVGIDGVPSSPAETKFLTLAARIDPIELDTSIFSDPRFMRLVDIRTAILPEASGRIDPFAPLGR